MAHRAVARLAFSLILVVSLVLGMTTNVWSILESVVGMPVRYDHKPYAEVIDDIDRRITALEDCKTECLWHGKDVYKK